MSDSRLKQRITNRVGGTYTNKQQPRDAAQKPMFDKRDPPDDGLFELLANNRRRLLLHRLVDNDGEAHLRELSREVVAEEMDAEPEAIEDPEVTRVYVSLYQTHVPALEDNDLVEYDDSERVVRLGDRTDELFALLESWAQRRRRWAIYYFLVALVLGGIVLLYVAPLIPIPTVVIPLFTFGGAVSLLGLAAAHYYGIRLPRIGDHPFDELAP